MSTVFVDATSVDEGTEGTRVAEQPVKGAGEEGMGAAQQNRQEGMGAAQPIKGAGEEGDGAAQQNGKEGMGAAQPIKGACEQG